MVRIQVWEHLPGAREEGAKDMSEEEQLPEERWRRVSMSGSLRGRRSEEMTLLNAFSPQGSEVPLEYQRGDGN